MRRPYLRLVLMTVTSTVMMLGLTYVNSWSIEHVHWSETRFFMAILMGAAMATVMLLYMRPMYRSAKLNGAILGVCALAFSGALWLVRSQATVGEVSWMRAMIPHHSIAILTSERADLRDPRVRELARQIIEAQRREIEEMKQLVAELS